MNPVLAPVLITALAVGAVYKYGRQMSNMKGDAAQVGDRVDVPTAALPAGGLPPGLPQGVGYIVVSVQNAGPDFLDGMVTGYILQLDPRLETSLPTPVGPVRIPRSVVTNVTRTKQVA